MTAGVAPYPPQGNHLSLLTEALKHLSAQGPKISTADFVQCCDRLMPFFDHLGPVFQVARVEFQHKLHTIRDACARQPTLDALVASDKASGRSTVKNSSTRNLHRLVCGLLFLKLLFDHMLKYPHKLLREAASEAYEASIAPFHTALIRGVVRAGMLTLPNRDHFLQSIGETEDTARFHGKDVVSATDAVVTQVNKLFAGITMPTSDVWFWPSS